jgi:acetyltransferase-like isoleucine patch superfamily enzyme
MKRILKEVLRKIFPNFFNNRYSVKFIHGKRFYSNTHIDTLIPQLVEIGDNFISAPGSLITAHDASTFLFSGKYRIEKVKIGNNVFLGANSVVLPGVTVGDNVIIGAGSVVSRNLNSNGVYAGNPAKFICTVDEYLLKCDKKNILFEVPFQMKEEFEKGIRFSKASVVEFQSNVIN